MLLCIFLQSSLTATDVFRDETQVQYIFSAVQVEPATTSHGRVTDTVSHTTPGISGASAWSEDEAVDQIQKILPHLGKGFVKVNDVKKAQYW